MFEVLSSSFLHKSDCSLHKFVLGVYLWQLSYGRCYLVINLALILSAFEFAVDFYYLNDKRASLNSTSISQQDHSKHEEKPIMNENYMLV